MITVCYADVSPLRSDALFEAAMASLPEIRRKKAASIRTRSAQNLSVGAALVLSECVKKHGYDINDLVFGVQKGGKPYIKNEKLHFSLSHSGSIAMCALAKQPVGIDAEEIAGFNPQICKRFFGKGECAQVFALKDEEALREAFFRIWTMKESYVKMTGKGLGGFSSFEVSLHPYPHVKNAEAACVLTELCLEGYKATLCASFEDEISFERMNIIRPFVETP